MQFSTTLALLAVTSLDSVLAQPHRHHQHNHRDLKDVDWNDKKHYEKVDWNKVFGLDKAPTPPTAPTVHQPAGKPADNPAPSNDDSSEGERKSFGGRTDPVDNGNKDEYKGNNGIPYGSNMIQLANPDDIKNYKYSNTFTNGGTEKISVAVWNKGGIDGRPQSGMALPPHIKFDIGVGEVVALVFDENSQIGFAKDGHRNQYGLLTTAWGEADFGDLRNQGWSGYDRSTIVQEGNEGLLTISCEGAKTSSQHGNSFLTAAQTNAGGALPPGPAHLKTTIG